MEAAGRGVPVCQRGPGVLAPCPRRGAARLARSVFNIQNTSASVYPPAERRGDAWRPPVGDGDVEPEDAKCMELTARQRVAALLRCSSQRSSALAAKR